MLLLNGRWMMVLSVLAVLCLTCPGAHLKAQPAIDEQKALTETEGELHPDLQELLQILENDDEREVFITRLRALVDAQEALSPEAETTELISSFQSRLQDWYRRISALTLDLPEMGSWLVEQTTNRFNRRYWGELFFVLMISILPALLLAGLVQKMGRRRLKGRTGAGELSLKAKCDRAGRTIAVDLCAAAMFYLGARISLWVSSGWFNGLASVQHEFSIICIWAITWIMLVLAMLRRVYAPNSPHLRPFPLSDERASQLHRWTRLFAILGILGLTVSEALPNLRVPATLAGGFERAIGLSIAILILIFTRQQREMVNRWLDPERAQSRRVRSLLAMVRDLWRPVLVIYVLATYIIWALAIPGGFAVLGQGVIGTIVILVFARPVALWLKKKTGQERELSDDFVRRYPGLVRRLDRYQFWLASLLPALVFAIAGYFIFLLWGIDLINLMFGDIRQESLDIAIKALWTLFLIAFMWELSGILLENYLEQSDQTGAILTRSGRERTLLPLARTVLLAVMTAFALLSLLSDLGVDTAPLLATAGVIGIAIGFGSQKLVQDVITGLIVLAQDTVSIGDVVETAGHSGVVESISIRTLELRDLEGAVHTIPFSAVSTVRNLTKGYSYALIDIHLPYDQPVEPMVELFKHIGAEMQADDEIGIMMLEPIEIFGVERFADSTLVLRARIRSTALNQWAIRRSFNARLKHYIDELGIKLPYPQQTVHMVNEQQGPATQAATP